MTTTRALIVRSFACFLLGWSGEAAAYVCTPSFDGGPSLAWTARTIEMKAVARDAEEVAEDEIMDALAHGIAEWSDVACSDFVLDNGGDTNDDRAGFDWAEGSGSPLNENILVFRANRPGEAEDAWLHPVSALAITTVTYVRSSGEILDADIEMNDGAFEFSACDPGFACDVAYDIKNTITHELGHVIGLDHPPSSQPGASSATMFATANAGDIDKRDLASDDVNGMCAIYPTGEPAHECYGVGRRPPPDIEISPSIGCQAAPASGLWAFGALGLSLAFGRARRSSARRRPW